MASSDVFKRPLQAGLFLTFTQQHKVIMSFFVLVGLMLFLLTMQQLRILSLEKKIRELDQARLTSRVEAIEKDMVDIGLRVSPLPPPVQHKP